MSGVSHLTISNAASVLPSPTYTNHIMHDLSEGIPVTTAVTHTYESVALLLCCTDSEQDFAENGHCDCAICAGRNEETGSLVNLSNDDSCLRARHDLL